jgi:magnesium transporter
VLRRSASSIARSLSLGRPSDKDLAMLLALRRNTVHLRHWISKQRDNMLRLSRNEFGLVAAQDAILFRDVYDHLQRFSDLLENYRELTTSIQEAYLSVANSRLNEIMKFLTIFTAMFMPLTVITGIYGMNFQYMPELHWRYGYPAVVAGMAAISAGLLKYNWSESNFQ